MFYDKVVIYDKGIVINSVFIHIEKKNEVIIDIKWYLSYAQPRFMNKTVIKIIRA